MLLLKHRNLILEFTEVISADYKKNLCPAQHFKMMVKGVDVGHLNFRLGQNKQMLTYAGQIGYTVKEEYRGKRYATYALKAVLPHCFQYYQSIFVTCDTDNIASIKTIESVPFKFHGIKKIPKTNVMYGLGMRKKRLYELINC